MLECSGMKLDLSLSRVPQLRNSRVDLEPDFDRESTGFRRDGQPLAIPPSIACLAHHSRASNTHS